MPPGLLNRLSRRSAPREPISLAELRGRFAAMGRDDLYRLRRCWTARYLPIWYAVHDTVADAAGWEETKRAKHRDAMDHALERTDGWWRRAKQVKARRNEIESAVSALTHFAPQFCAGAPWVPQARLAALEMRHLLQFVYDPASDFCITQSAHAVYDWGQLETWWPGDTATMYGALPAELLRAQGQDALPLVYTEGARATGLRRQGQAVVDAVHTIVAHLGEDPGPFPAEGILDRGPGDEVRQRQRDAGYLAFHGRPRPPFVR